MNDPVQNLRRQLEAGGFVEDSSIYSEDGPGLCLNVGGLELTAAFLTGAGFQDVILFTGLVQSERALKQVQFEIPREACSGEMLPAWVAWNLEKKGAGASIAHWPWLAEGKTRFHLLP